MLTMKQTTTVTINNINKPTALLRQMKFVHNKTDNAGIHTRTHLSVTSLSLPLYMSGVCVTYTEKAKSISHNISNVYTIYIRFVETEVLKQN